MRAILMAGLFATAIAAGACGDDADPVDPAVEAAAVGTYTLMSINGAALPFTYGQNDTTRAAFTEGKIILEANHNMTDELTSVETRIATGDSIGEPAVQRYLGTWSIRGDSVRLSYPGLGVQMAGRTSTTLSLADNANNTFLYSK